MPADYNVIDRFLAAYLNAIDSGFGLIRPDVLNVMSLLIVIAIGLAAVFWALDENNNVTAALFRKILLIGFFAWLVNDWSGLTKTIVLGFAQLGLKAGGAGVNVNTFLSSPSDLVYMGMKLVTGMSIQMKELSGPIGFFENFAMILVLGIAIIGVIIAFVILAVQVFVTIIEFRLVTLAAFILIPFGILKQTSFLSDRALGYVASSGLKVLTIALIVSVGSKTFETLTLSPVPSIESAISILIASVVLMMLALVVPSIAAALITGGPQIGAGAALAGAAGVAAGAGAAYLTGRAAIGAPGAIAAKAKAAAGAIGGGGAAPSSGGGSAGGGGPAGGGMQPANSPSGGGNITDAGTSGAPRASKAAAGTPRQDDAPTDNGTTDRAAPAPEQPTSGVPAAPAVSSRPAANDESTATPAPSSAPPASETVRRAEARRRIVTPTSHAQAAVAATSAQGGAGMTATIEHDED